MTSMGTGSPTFIVRIRADRTAADVSPNKDVKLGQKGLMATWMGSLIAHYWEAEPKDTG